IARRALHASIELRTGDLSCAELPSCQAVTLLDVLFLMTPREQQTHSRGLDGPAGEPWIQSQGSTHIRRHAVRQCPDRSAQGLNLYADSGAKA
ncbi:MAG: hypothetical protein M3120_03705, partial [Pseudomonadota bacterium]|nr:hypothetical protein [Pseudomonadota bacterium]